MRVNDSPLFRTARVIVGTTLLAAGVFGWFSGARAVILGIVGAVLLITGVIGIPAIYALLGMPNRPNGPKKL